MDPEQPGGQAERLEDRAQPPGDAAGKDVKMSEVTYQIVEHDGGWAYKVGDVYSETFATHQLAHAAAATAAREQRTPGRTEEIQYEDSAGRWHEETARGSERPDTSVKD
jgi:hypothetical protein